MLVTLICVAAICVLFGITAHSIDSSYEDFKKYMNSKNENNNR